MGERGPDPIPWARRRNKRRGYGTSIEVARPPMPRDLPAEAKAEWRRVVPTLEGMGLLATIDRGVLIRYCRAWADWCELVALIASSGKLIKAPRGIVRNPAWLLKRDVEQSLADLARQLGLTPTARLRAGVRHERPPDPEEESISEQAIKPYREMLGEDA